MVLHNALYHHFDGMTVADFIRNQKTMTIDERTSVANALRTMKESRVSSLPVTAASSTAIVGQVDTLDIVNFVSTLLPGDLFDPDEEAHACKSLLSAMSHTAAASLADRCGRNPSVAVLDSDHASVLIDLFARGTHRALVFHVPDADAILSQVHNPDYSWVASHGTLVGVVSQSSLADELAQAIPRVPALRRLCERTLQELGIGVRTVSTVMRDSSVTEAVQILAATRFSAVAVVDSETGQLCGNFSAVDVEGMISSDGAMSRLTMSVIDYLRELSPRSLSPVCMTANSTLQQCLETMAAQRVHRVWVTNQGGEPIGVVSFTDIFKLAASQAANQNLD